MTDLPTDDPAGGPPGGGDDHVLAGEYVLGVLDHGQRQEAQRRIASEAGFAGAVSWWEHRLTPLAEEVQAVEPSAGLWPRISNLIAPRQRLGAWHDVRTWRAVSIGALGLAAACLVIVALPHDRPAPPVVAPSTPQVAVIADPATHEALLVATLDNARRQLALTPVKLALPPGRDAELWIIPEGGKPISLGVIAAATPTRMVAPDSLQDGGVFTATLAVTDEPPGGSPTGAPTGSIRAAGQFIRGS